MEKGLGAEDTLAYQSDIDSFTFLRDRKFVLWKKEGKEEREGGLSNA